MSIQQNILLDSAAPGSFSPKTQLSHLRTFAHAGTLPECPSPLVCLGEPALHPSAATPGCTEAAASLHCSSICLSAMLWAILISGAPAPPRQGLWLIELFFFVHPLSSVWPPSSLSLCTHSCSLSPSPWLSPSQPLAYPLAPAFPSFPSQFPSFSLSPPLPLVPLLC